MSTLAIVTMCVICGIVWGGFSVLLVHALRKERQKSEADDEA